MASIRHATTDCAHRAAVDHLMTYARRPWEDWHQDAPIAELLQFAGGHLGALRTGIGSALAIFTQTRDPARGLSAVYLMQALVVAEMDTATNEPETSAEASACS